MKAAVALLLLGSAGPALAQHNGHQMAPGMVMPTPKPTLKKMPPPPKAAPVKPALAKPSRPKPAGSKPVAKKPAAHSTHADHSMPSAADIAETAQSSDAKQVGSGLGEMSGMDHSAMDHGQMDHGGMDMPMGDASMEQSTMDHSEMDHGGMDYPMIAAPTVETPPPAAAGSGPARAADAIWGADAMAASRAELAATHGGQQIFWFMADRAEYRIHDGRDGYVWDLQGSYGGDLDKFFYKSEGEGNFGEHIERAEVQALLSHAIAPFFDFQAGVRQDFAPRDRTYAVIGVQGLAPYRFEIDSALFLSDRGDLTARLEVELDQRISQRLILQPRVEMNLAAQDVPELGIGAGLDRVESGLRLRYEIVREFAPYIGVEQEWRIGRSARYARGAGEDQSVTNYVAGIKIWF
ncbi:copper resistance protein B [Novosphingopyxis sp.]|uniref:copper resistance protein B n=1 Tax=Novosphingopyxis sp. TaxID=2709690 RepID=UPI003B5B4920